MHLRRFLNYSPHIRTLVGDVTTAATAPPQPPPPQNPFILTREDILKSPFRCLENNPVNHTVDHISRFYTVDPDHNKRLFTFGGLLREFKRKAKTFTELCFMVRQPAVEVINCIKNSNFSYPVNRYILFGLEGCGKTISLAHILHYLSYEPDFLLIHVPWPAVWLRFPKEVVPSTYKSGRVDQPVEAVAWLQQFKLQNQRLLQEKQPKIVNSYTWSQREKTEEGSLLTDIIDQGINRAKFSSDCVGVVVKESKLLAMSGQVKVAVVIDGVNSFFYTSRIKREDRSLYNAQDLTLIRAFTTLLWNDWKNGVVVTSIDTIAAPSDCRDSHLPRYLLGKQGFEMFDPFVPIAVESYTEKEINSCLDYYIDRLWIQSEKGKTEEGRQQLMFLSGHNPEKLMKICGPT